jgi:hypothetical protein
LRFRWCRCEHLRQHHVSGQEDCRCIPALDRELMGHFGPAPIHAVALRRPQEPTPRSFLASPVGLDIGNRRNRRTLTGTSPNSDREVMLRYPLLDKFNPQCPQDLKCSLIVDACARTISAWIVAAILLPSSSDRPSVSGTAESSLSIRVTSISVAVRLSRPQVSPAKPASPQRCPLAKGPELSVQRFTGPPRLCILPRAGGITISSTRRFRRICSTRGGIGSRRLRHEGGSACLRTNRPAASRAHARFSREARSRRWHTEFVGGRQ